MSFSIYFHIPFCKSKCVYCDFYSVTSKPDAINNITTYYKKELDLYLPLFSQRNIDTIYFGGGTPSLLNPKIINDLLSLVEKKTKISPNCEITIEANPNNITNENLNYWKISGINRLSIGIQSFNDNNLKILRRTHDTKTITNALNSIKNSGWINISADLIFGIPKQTMDEWKFSLNKAIEWNFKHLSIYGLTCEKNTPLFKLVQNKKIEMPDNTLYNKMFFYTDTFLKNNGYSHYEISNYSIPKFESKHNSLFWEGKDYLGIGPSAHSMIQGKRWANVRDIKEYSNRLEKNKLPTKWEQTLTQKEKIIETILTELRTSKGIDTEKLKSLGYDILHTKSKQLEELIKHKHIEIKSKSIILTIDGMTVSDEISLLLIDQLQ